MFKLNEETFYVNYGHYKIVEKNNNNKEDGVKVDLHLYVKASEKKGRLYWGAKTTTDIHKILRKRLRSVAGVAN